MKKVIPGCLISSALPWAVLLLLLSACTPPRQPAATPENRTGITATEILIGASLALGGHAGYLGTQMLQGATTYIRYINAKGGIHGRKIHLIALDDRYNPAQCLYNTQQLIMEKKVFALFCYVGTPTTVKIIPLINEARIPLVGMFTGANRLRHPVNPYLINIRASYYQETRAAVDFMVLEKKIQRIAVFYQYDEYGFDGLRGTEIALKKHGLVPVAKGSYVRGTLEIESGLENIMVSRADAVVMIGTYDACARFILRARDLGYDPLFHNVSFVGSKELARRLGSRGEGVMVTQVVPPPTAPDTARLPGVRAYVSQLADAYPRCKPSFVGLEGYLNARILVEGLRRAGPDITRQKFIAALASIENYDLGIQNSLSFGPDDTQGLDDVYFTVIQGGELVLMK